jgi:hypothetical protein
MEPELVPGDHTQAHPEVSGIQVIPAFEYPHKKGKADSFEEAQIIEKLMEHFTHYDGSQAHHEVGASG